MRTPGRSYEGQSTSDSTAIERSLIGPYRALHPDPWTSLSSHPGFVSVRALLCSSCAIASRACLSDLVRKFAHVFGVRTQWPLRREQARVRPLRGRLRLVRCECLEIRIELPASRAQ